MKHSIYVDPLMQHGWCLRGRKTHSCHMFMAPADDLEPLHKMAEAIGLKRAWFQESRVPHYDLTVGRRAAAVARGVVCLDRAAAVEVFRAWEQPCDGAESEAK